MACSASISLSLVRVQSKASTTRTSGRKFACWAKSSIALFELFDAERGLAGTMAVHRVGLDDAVLVHQLGCGGHPKAVRPGRDHGTPPRTSCGRDPPEHRAKRAAPLRSRSRLSSAMWTRKAVLPTPPGPSPRPGCLVPGRAPSRCLPRRPLSLSERAQGSVVGSACTSRCDPCAPSWLFLFSAASLARALAMSSSPILAGTGEYREIPS